MYYGYEDWTREEAPRCCYCGIGNESRVENLIRNHKHTHITKTFGQDRHIVFMTSDWDVAKSWEINAIAENNTFYLDNPEIGCNFTRGGDGCVGYKQSQEERERRSRSVKVAWTNHKNKERLFTAIHAPEAITKKANGIKQHWSKSGVREIHGKNVSKRWARMHEEEPEKILALGELQHIVQSKIWSEPERLAQHAKQARKIRNDPANKAKRHAQDSNHRARVKQAETMRIRRAILDAKIVELTLTGMSRRDVSEQLNVTMRTVYQAVSHHNVSLRLANSQVCE